MDEADVSRLLLEACGKAGGQRAFAKIAEVSPQFINLIIQRQRSPGPTVLRLLRLKRVVSYARWAPKDMGR